MSVHTTWGDGLVEVDIAIPDLDVEPAIRVNTHPSFVMNCGSLSAVIRQRYQLTNITLKTLWHYCIFHENNLPILIQAEYITAFSLGTRQFEHCYFPFSS